VRLAALGWTLALGARRLERLEETAASVVEAGGKAFAHPLDITDPASVDAFFAAAEDAVGPIDAVVNNAGAAMPGPIEQVTAEAVRRDVETNLTGPLLVARRAIATLKQKGLRGDVLFISSAAAGTPWPRQVAYASAKAGIEYAAIALSRELEGTGIRSLYLRVGNTITEFSAGWGPELLMESSLYWRDLRIIRHDGLLSVEQVADAVAVALATPPGVHLESMTVHPEAP
jgi:NAD(P)-dependent dehydrogenase (short-subunit alcohol dehydrogenase family)